MKYIILSSYALVDRLWWKTALVNRLAEANLKPVGIVYDSSSPLDYLKGGLRRFGTGIFRAGSNLAAQVNVEGSPLYHLAKQLNIPVKQYHDFNQESCLKWIEAQQVDLVINTSGHFIPTNLISSTRLGVISGHYGYLPTIRGSNTVHWTILQNQELWISIMFLATKMDLGDIILRRKVPVQIGDTMKQIRRRCQAEVLDGHFAVLTDLAMEGEVRPIKQRESGGKSYYRMNPLLVNMVDDLLQKGLYKHAVE